MFIETAFAQAGQPPQPSMFEMIFPFLLMFGVLYFFMIRPAVKRQKEQETLLANLKRGQQVLTSGGVLGTIEGITEGFVTLEISDDVRIKVLKSSVQSMPKEKEG